jgi:hypothetical protein
MIGLAIVAAVIGFIAGIVLSSSTVGWIVFAVIFICGLPFALIGMFIHGEVRYTQDCAYDRQVMSDLAADRRAEEHEDAADRRARKRKRGITQIYCDNRQVYFSSGGRYDPDALV